MREIVLGWLGWLGWVGAVGVSDKRKGIYWEGSDDDAPASGGARGRWLPLPFFTASSIFFGTKLPCLGTYLGRLPRSVLVCRSISDRASSPISRISSTTTHDTIRSSSRPTISSLRYCHHRFEDQLIPKLKHSYTRTYPSTYLHTLGT